VVGTTQNVSAEIALPGSTVEYYKLSYDVAKYWPLSPALVLRTGVNLGYGDSYGDDFVRNLCYTAPTPPTTSNPNPPPPPPPTDPCLVTSPDYDKTVTATGLPFFENFYAGGIAAWQTNGLPVELGDRHSGKWPVGASDRDSGAAAAGAAAHR